MCPVVSHNHAYSFGVSCLRLSRIIMLIHLVSHVSGCITYPSASHIQAPHIIMPIHLVYHVYSFGVPHLRVYHVPKCLTHQSVPHNHAYSFGVSCLRLHHVPKCLTHPSAPHNHAYSFGVACLRLSRIIMPIHLVSHVLSCLT